MVKRGGDQDGQGDPRVTEPLASTSGAASGGGKAPGKEGGQGGASAAGPLPVPGLGELATLQEVRCNEPRTEVEEVSYKRGQHVFKEKREYIVYDPHVRSPHLHSDFPPVPEVPDPNGARVRLLRLLDEKMRQFMAPDVLPPQVAESLQFIKADTSRGEVRRIWALLNDALRTCPALHFDTERVLNTMCVAKVLMGVHTGLVVVVDTLDRAKSEGKTPTEDWTEFVPAEIAGLVLQESNIVFGMGIKEDFGQRKPERWLDLKAWTLDVIKANDFPFFPKEDPFNAKYGLAHVSELLFGTFYKGLSLHAKAKKNAQPGAKKPLSEAEKHEKVYPTPYKLKRVGSTCWPAWKHPLNYYNWKERFQREGHAYLRNDGVSGFLVPLLSAIELVATSSALTEQRGPAQVLGFAIEVAWRRSRGEVLPERGRQLEAKLVAKQLGDHAEGLVPEGLEPAWKKAKTEESMEGLEEGGPMATQQEEQAHPADLVAKELDHDREKAGSTLRPVDGPRPSQEQAREFASEHLMKDKNLPNWMRTFPGLGDNCEYCGSGARRSKGSGGSRHKHKKATCRLYLTRQETGLLCTYPVCRTPDTHMIGACREMRSRCALCGYMGHHKDTCGEYSFEEYKRMYEDFRDQHVLVKRRPDHEVYKDAFEFDLPAGFPAKMDCRWVQGLKVGMYMPVPMPVQGFEWETMTPEERDRKLRKATWLGVPE